MFPKVKAFGPTDAKIMIVGEAPGHDEVVHGKPFIGRSGEELTKMLHEVGLVRAEMFITNACKYRPPGNEIDAFFLDSKRKKPNELLVESVNELKAEIEMVSPELILALGDTALWALTGNHGITKWRGSQLRYNGIRLVPTYHPALVLREWSWRAIAIHDMRRAKEWLEGSRNPPTYNFTVRPTYAQVNDTLDYLLSEAGKRSDSKLRLASDLETRAGHIACTGLAWSRVDAICIPDMCIERPTGYWTLEEDLAIWLKLRSLHQHENVEVIGQNYSYDSQYFARRRGYLPRCKHDTMVMQHVLWAGLPKGLDFLASMYCEYYEYWKDESKDWDPKVGEDQLWTYNCKDSTATYEVAEVLLSALEQAGLMEVYQFQMNHLWPAVLRMMLRGVKINQQRRSEVALELIEAIQKREEEMQYILGSPLNVKSPKQMQSLFYGVLKLPVQRHRKTKRPTTDDSAMDSIGTKWPELRPITRRVQELRSLGVFLSNFVRAPLDPDGRMHCTFNITGTETFRFSSSESAFGTGTNLQNIPSGDPDDPDSEKKALLPNVRKLFIPDNGYEIADVDLAGADAQVVAWEANDEKLKNVFRQGLKIHAVNARDIFGDLAGPDGLQMPYYHRAKTGVHLTNYGGSARTCAGALGIPIWEAQRFQDRWFTLHPEIEEWHADVEHLLQTKRQVTNRFKYRRFYFERVEGLLPEALAWVPQSTVACVCNRALVQIDEDPECRRLDVQILLQVHDSLVIQYPVHNRDQVLKRLKQIIWIPVPYEDPLTIPWGLKTSSTSWGDCQKRQWPEE